MLRPATPTLQRTSTNNVDHTAKLARPRSSAFRQKRCRSNTGHNYDGIRKWNNFIGL